MPKAILKFIFLFVLCFLTTACLRRMPIKETHLKTPHDITVIPYSGAPISVNFPTGYYPVAGVIAQAVEYSMKKDWRKSIIDDLNKAAVTWNPALIYAEECSKVLADSSKITIAKSTIADTGQLPGTEKYQEPFREVFLYGELDRADVNPWSKFNDTDMSLQEYRKVHSQIMSDWFLEVYSLPSAYTYNKIEFILTLKLSNASNQVIASGYRVGRHDIPETMNGYNFNDINLFLRESSKKTCTDVLRDMGLI